MEKSMNLLSNFMLVEDIGRVLNLPENINLLSNVFDDLMKVNLTSKSSGYLISFLRLNKFFMIVFCRMFHNNPNLFKNDRILMLLNLPVIKNWETVKEFIKSKIINDEVKVFIKVYNDFFSCFAEIYENVFKLVIPQIDNLVNLLKIVISV